MHQCRSCKAPITWATTENGKRIPVDPKPRADGNLVLLGAGRGGAPLAVIFNAVQHAGRQRYVSHFATCAWAGAHRSKR
jgi:hypothetical protein